MLVDGGGSCLVFFGGGKRFLQLSRRSKSGVFLFGEKKSIMVRGASPARARSPAHGSTAHYKARQSVISKTPSAKKQPDPEPERQVTVRFQLDTDKVKPVPSPKNSSSSSGSGSVATGDIPAPRRSSLKPFSAFSEAEQQQQQQQPPICRTKLSAFFVSRRQ